LSWVFFYKKGYKPLAKTSPSWQTLIAPFALNCLTEEVEEKVEAPLQPNGLQLP